MAPKKTTENNKLEISWTSLWKVFVVVIIGFALFYVSDILLAIYTAIIVSLALHSVVDYLERYKIPRLLGTIFIFIGAIALVSVMVKLIIPVAIDDSKVLLSHLDLYSLGFLGMPIPDQAGNEITNAISNLPGFLSDKSSSILKITGSFATGAALTFATLLMTFYLTLSKNGFENLIKQILPRRYESDFLDVFHKAKNKIGLWLQAQVILSLFVGVLVFIGLTLLGVKSALVLAILAGIFEIVPLVGPIFSGGMALLVAFSQSPDLGLYTLILFIAIQQIESHVVIPLLMGKTMDVNPVMILAALLIGGKLAGFMGVVLAVPTIVIFQEWFNFWVNKKSLENGETKV